MSIKDFLRSTVLHVAFAFVAMGAWAFYANSEHGAFAASRAAVAQGAVSALITLFMKKTIDFLFVRIPDRLWRRVMPVLAVCAAGLTVLLTVHSLAGTPDILETISLPYSVATVYAIVYTVSLPSPESARPRKDVT